MLNNLSLPWMRRPSESDRSGSVTQTKPSMLRSLPPWRMLSWCHCPPRGFFSRLSAHVYYHATKETKLTQISMSPLARPIARRTRLGFLLPVNWEQEKATALIALVGYGTKRQRWMSIVEIAAKVGTQGGFGKKTRECCLLVRGACKTSRRVSRLELFP